MAHGVDASVTFGVSPEQYRQLVLLDQIKDAIQRVGLLADAGYVQYFPANGLFVAATGTSGLLGAAIITDSELHDYPTFVNGRGDRSRMIPMITAKQLEIANLSTARRSILSNLQAAYGAIRQ